MDFHWIIPWLFVEPGFYFIFLYKPKIKDKPLSEEEINAVINLFGGKENIKAITKEGSRYSFKLDKVEKCNLEKIKEFGATGVFVSGDVVKLIFPFNADVIMEKFSL